MTPQKTQIKHREADAIVVLHCDLKQRCKQPTRCNNFRLLIFYIDLFEYALHVSGEKLAHLL